MKKILILSMFCNNEHYINEFNIIKETWAKPILEKLFDNIDFWGYTSSIDGKTHINTIDKIISVNSPDDRFHTYTKTYKVLSFINSHPEYFGNYTYIFRTNTSTFINIQLLQKFVDNIKNEDIIYAGNIFSRIIQHPYPYDCCLVGHSLLFHKKYINVLEKDFNENTDDDKISECFFKYFYQQNKNPLDFIKMFGCIDYGMKEKRISFIDPNNIHNILNSIATRVTVYNIDKSIEYNYLKDLNNYYIEHINESSLYNINNLINDDILYIWNFSLNYSNMKEYYEYIIPIYKYQIKNIKDQIIKLK